MFRHRSFWVYSTGLVVVWGVLLIIVFNLKSPASSTVLLIFGGFCIGWVSTTIARYVYPPPKKWAGQLFDGHIDKG